MMKWKKYHRVISIIICLPLFIIGISGVFLQLRNQFEFIQPSLVKGDIDSKKPLQSLEVVTETYGAKNIDQIIWKPSKMSLVVRLLDGAELQLHPQTGEILKKAQRRTNLFIDIHQGSWMGPIGQYFIHLMTAFGLLFLVVSGLKIYPFKKKKKNE